MLVTVFVVRVYVQMSFPRTRESRSKYHVPLSAERYSRDRAHKMYFLCKTNPMSSHPKIGLTDYITRSYVVFGHLVNGKSKPNQTQSNPIVARPSWPRSHRTYWIAPPRALRGLPRGAASKPQALGTVSYYHPQAP